MGELIQGAFGENKVDAIRMDNGKLPDYMWPGGYPLYYITKNGVAICPDCANKEGAEVVNYDANWEDPEMYCDECNARIPSAYAEDDEDGEE